MAISNHGSRLGGGEHSFLDLLLHMPLDWQPFAVVPEKAELAFRLSKKGIDTHVLPLSPIRPWLLSKVISSLKNYHDLCRKCGPDLVYANGSRAAFYGGITARRLNIPIIWHCRIAEHDSYLDSFLSRLSTVIITNSQATSERFKGRFPEKVRLVYNGIDLHWMKTDVFRMPDAIEAAWKIILVIARVSRWKRHDLALKAFEKVAEAEPKAHLVCVGAKDHLDSGWWDELHGISSQSAFAERIHWIGQVEDIRPWLRSAFLLLLASDGESFGRVLIEAMACGVPVIATRSGGIPEVVREGIDGLLVAPGNVEEISDAIARLFTNDALRRRLSDSGLRRSEEYNLDAHVKRMTEVFGETVSTFTKCVRK